MKKNQEDKRVRLLYKIWPDLEELDNSKLIEIIVKRDEFGLNFHKQTPLQNAITKFIESHAKLETEKSFNAKNPLDFYNTCALGCTEKRYVIEENEKIVGKIIYSSIRSPFINHYSRIFLIGFNKKNQIYGKIVDGLKNFLKQIRTHVNFLN